MNHDTKLSRLPASLFDNTMKREARITNYSQEVLHMSYEEIDSIPCITESEVD